MWNKIENVCNVPRTRQALLDWREHQDWMRYRKKIKHLSGLVFCRLDGTPIKRFDKGRLVHIWYTKPFSSKKSGKASRPTRPFHYLFLVGTRGFEPRTP